jgi:uncharacterized SAM-binding protein YcdF (DUF218 family)
MPRVRKSLQRAPRAEFLSFCVSEQPGCAEAQPLDFAQRNPAKSITELGLTPTEQDLTRQILLQQGVPASDLITIGHNVSSSYEEALAVQQWLSTNQNQHLIIPTDPFHTRRVNWLYHKLLRDTPTQLSIQSVPQPQYSPSNWWQTEEGLIAFQNEVIKYAFYRLKY